MLLAQTCLGADIRDDEIRIVELQKTGRKYKVLQAARIALSSSKPDAVASALQSFLHETQTKPGSIVCSLPSQICSVKFTRIPKAKPSDAAKIVRYEAETQIPLPLNDVAWNYTADQEDDDSLHITIGSARKQTVEALLSAMDEVHLHPSSLMISSLAGARSAACHGTTSEPVMVIDFGREWTDICIADANRVYGAHSIRLGVDNLTEAMVQDLQMSVQEAERLQHEQGIAYNIESPRVEEWIKTAAEEIRRTVVSLTYGRADKWPAEGVLIGHASGISGLAAALGKLVGIRIEDGDPWNAMTLSDVCAATLSEAKGLYAVATGLAMAGLDGAPSLNLRPQRITEEHRRRQKEAALITGLGAMAVVLLLMLIARAPTLHERRAELDKLQSQVTQVNSEIKHAGLSHKDEAVAVKELVTCIETDGYGCLTFLERASEQLPKNIWLSDLSFETGKTVVIKGQASSNFSVGDTVDALVFLDIFDSVNLDYSNLANGDKSHEFQITCTLRGSKGKGSVESKPAGLSQTGVVVQ